MRLLQRMGVAREVPLSTAEMHGVMRIGATGAMRTVVQRRCRSVAFGMDGWGVGGEVSRGGLVVGRSTRYRSQEWGQSPREVGRCRSVAFGMDD
jgi:hypothetical protein